MKSVSREVVCDLLLLSLTAGSADAAGYLGLGGVFTSNMTGNVVLMGIHAGEGHLVMAIRTLGVIGIFFCGVSLGAWLGKKLSAEEWPELAFRLIGLEKILLLVFALGWLWMGSEGRVGSGGSLLLVVLALAMGVQLAALFRLSAPGVGTTAVTGTLTAFASSLVNFLFIPGLGSAEKASNLQRVGFQAGVVFLYASGAACEGWLIMHAPAWAGFFPVLAAFFIAVRRGAKVA